MILVRSAALAAVAISSIMLGVEAEAMPRVTDAQAPQFITKISDRISTSNMTIAYFNGGKFSRVNGTKWVEQGDNGAVFNFVEISKDDNFVYLNDPSRNVQIAIGINTRKIHYAENGGEFRDLYQVTRFAAGSSGVVSSQPPSVEVVNYSCNEGIPLIVRYEEVNGDTIAYASHDSSPEIRMPQVVSGSGVMFESGKNVLHTKGKFAYVNFDGIEDNCNEDR